MGITRNKNCEFDAKKADVNGDGKVSLTDIAKLEQDIIGLIDLNPEYKTKGIIKHLGRDGGFVIADSSDKVDHGSGKIESIDISGKSEIVSVVNVRELKVFEDGQKTETATISGTADMFRTDEGNTVIETKRDVTDIDVFKDKTVVKNDGTNTKIDIYGKNVTVLNSSGPLKEVNVFRSDATIYGSDLGDNININGYSSQYGPVTNTVIHGGKGHDVITVNADDTIINETGGNNQFFIDPKGSQIKNIQIKGGPGYNDYHINGKALDIKIDDFNPQKDTLTLSPDVPLDSIKIELDKTGKTTSIYINERKCVILQGVADGSMTIKIRKELHSVDEWLENTDSKERYYRPAWNDEYGYNIKDTIIHRGCVAHVTEEGVIDEITMIKGIQSDIHASALVRQNYAVNIKDSKNILAKIKGVR